ncbi:NAD synthetase / Glutamine amidotransferase chain of NAD synthetase (plasmid) [Euzebya pacifica]|uniref:Glutamine-dependent NAD(+) synthetase n=1 Tax=Euzebya pacifica TaxID=1608957 RepID=A0A346Y6P6_9ACTN|nr:NAD+ synthase [Euzebya pacifica]AXV10143.1 NAD synthetase / Glutamine amidotransferase chain of NAD synthetase [Euzebya pacifica]
MTTIDAALPSATVTTGPGVVVTAAAINPVLGDLAGNTNRIIDAVAACGDADVVVLGELAICGYPPQDLLLRPDFVTQAWQAVRNLAVRLDAVAPGVAVVLGAPAPADDLPHGAAVGVPADAGGARLAANVAVVLLHGRVVGGYAKRSLPTYGTFDETRVFLPGAASARGNTPVATVQLDDTRSLAIGLAVCEDLWTGQWVEGVEGTGVVDVVCIPNASPYEVGKDQVRVGLVSAAAVAAGVPVVYANLEGGQDDVVFDGHCIAATPGGHLVQRQPFGLPEPCGQGPIDPVAFDADLMADTALAQVWAALVTATRDYAAKTGFDRAVVGLSGGIDSAVTAAVVADALGGHNLLGVTMPGPHSSPMSAEDAEALAGNLAADFATAPIGGIAEAATGALRDVVASRNGTRFANPVTAENLQARARGMVLMAVSNDTGRLLVTTGNKSEYAVGYATLYGDMAGGFAVLKDLPKTLVYALARWRNRQPGGTVIPDRSITRPASAELSADQSDEDTLGDYPTLDRIVLAHVDADMNAATIATAGICDAERAARTVRMIELAEYKRRQAAPGPKITSRAFGSDRRLPIARALA